MALKKSDLAAIVCGLLFISPSLLWADTLYLKNGRSMDGLVKSEANDSIELEVNGGVVTFDKSQVERIERSGQNEVAFIRQKWEKEKIENQKKWLQQEMDKEYEPKNVEFAHDEQGMVLPVKLNNKVDTRMVLDTGATMMMLSKSKAEELGIKFDNVEPDMEMTVADGRKIKAKHIVIESVKVQNSEAYNVDASVLLEKGNGLDFGDGLLGMSFLKNFNFKIDYSNRKLVLEKR